jgi:hypothetical protein
MPQAGKSATVLRKSCGEIAEKMMKPTAYLVNLYGRRGAVLQSVARVAAPAGTLASGAFS